MSTRAVTRSPDGTAGRGEPLRAVPVASFRPVPVDLGLAAAVALSWHDQALCAEVDAELFFPEAEDDAESTAVQADQAHGVCLGCPVRAECLTHALARPEMFGTWGALSARELARERSSVPRRTAAEIIADADRRYFRRRKRQAAADDRRLAAERRRRAETAALLKLVA